MDHKTAAARIADSLDAGIVPWSRSIADLYHACELPVDAWTSQPIRGVNTWLLELAAIERGYRMRSWATREDWWDLGAEVVRHEPTPVVPDPRFHGRENEPGACLYNLEQVEVRRGAPVAALERFWVAPPGPDYEGARRFVDATGARVVAGEGAYYHRVGVRDWIEVPPASRFLFIGLYWRALLHELVHWAVLGVHRLGWYGDPCQGELVAELGSALLADRFRIRMKGLAIRGYREHPLLSDLAAAWIAGMRGDAGYLADACELAWRAADYLLTLGGAEPVARPADTAEGVLVGDSIR